ncbi:MAG: hypothetical protein HKN76_00260 [Saprospiraceae bacterium]|nr:hypothetical protein [Saprospiraceae bacterium]
MTRSWLVIFILYSLPMSAQDVPYYYEIPEAPESYSAANVAARLVDGLGFRYFWATEGLTESDLAYRPTEESRSSYETLVHIEGLTSVVRNAVSRKPNTGGDSDQEVTFGELRARTLDHIRQASEILKTEGANLEEFPIIFQRGENSTEYPFWNLINGPISDAIWHVGQIVSFRRSSGNPFPSGVSVLRGTKRD